MAWQRIALDLDPGSESPFFLSGETEYITQFADLFQRAWLRIPASARTIILRHWRNKEYECYMPYLLKISDWWSAPDRFAEVGLFGCEIKFCSRDFEVMPEDVAATVIAHELAHVYLYAVKRDDDLAVEDLTDRLISEWGFDCDARDTYRGSLRPKRADE